MAEARVSVLVLEHGRGLELPAYATAGSAGCDLRAAVTEPLELPPGEVRVVPTGICVAIPMGYEGQVRPRSGLATKHAVTVVNAPGTIDADYRGELRVALVNLGRQPYVISRGDRIAQLVLAPVTRAVFDVHDALDPTDRGAGGFGSTGTT